MSVAKFHAEPLKVKDAFLVTITEHVNDGLFVDCFDLLRSPSGTTQMPQITVSRSKKNVIRGMHCSPHHKLVQCPTGRAFDVVIDIRPDSPTFMQWDGRWIDKNHHMVIPGYCAHGFFSAEDDTAILYLQGGCFAPELDFSVHYLDPQVHVDWPSPIDASEYTISQKDKENPNLTPDLIEKLRIRVQNPQMGYEIAPYADLAVVSSMKDLALPFLQTIIESSKKVHLACGNGLKRDTLETEIHALRPKNGILALIDVHKDQADLFVEILNIAHIAANKKLPVTIVTNEPTFPGFENISKLVMKECSSSALFVLSSQPFDAQFSQVILQSIMSGEKGLYHYQNQQLVAH